MPDVLQLVLDHGLLAGLALFLLLVILYLLRLIFTPEKADIFRARAYQALAVLTNKRSFEKRFISNDIRGRLNLARKNIYFGKSIVPTAVGVEWVEAESPTPYDIREGQFIVRLDPRQNQASNTVAMADTIVKRTTLRGVRHVTNPRLCRAIELTLVKKLLRATGLRGALDIFYSEHYAPLRSGDPHLDGWVTRVAEIDDQGLFERLLLVELEDFARRVLHLEPRPYMIGEVEDLVKWVHSHATREEGQEATPLEFKRAHIKVGIVLVAKIRTIVERGAKPYLEAIRIGVENDGLDAIYLVVWGKSHLGSGRHRRYARTCRDLRKRIRGNPSLTEHFQTKYEYIDPRGYRREGEISRFLVQQ